MHDLIVATTPTVYGIETFQIALNAPNYLTFQVATTPTVYGIETSSVTILITRNKLSTLRQHLPFTVLKQGLSADEYLFCNPTMLRQHLPFTVLKRYPSPRMP